MNVTGVSGTGIFVQANKIEVIGKKVTQMTPTSPAENFTSLWKVPPKNSNFIGWSKLLKQLEDHFSQKTTPAVLTACHGLGGIGKTVALEFVWRHNEEYNGVVWFNAESRDQLQNDYISLGRKLNIIRDDHNINTEELACYVKHWFEDPSRAGWLLVYDNAGNYNTIRELHPTKGGKILITSRHTADWPQDIFTDVYTIEDYSTYFSKFDEFGVISFGSFGIVIKAKEKNKNELNAIKKIALNNNNHNSLMNEFEIMSNLKSDYVVEVKSAWIEDNYFIGQDFENFMYLNIHKSHRIFNPENPFLLHIQMELCYKTLGDIIKQLNTELNQKPFEIMTAMGYYIASELLIEILESVDYLHKQKPPIIHRDLKPSNILIAFKTDGRFVKLADFGLAKLQESEDQSNTSYVGTNKYMAPEVYTSRKYGTKADVFSLGVIIPELFNFNIDEKLDFENDFPLRGKYKNLFEVMENMTKLEKDLRSNCESILKEKTLWSLSVNDFENDSDFAEICEQTFNIERFEDNFHSVFIKRKFEIFNRLKQ